MAADTNDLVLVRAGSSTQIQLCHARLQSVGIYSRVVGDNRTAGPGAAGPGSVELWVHRADAAAAEVAIAGEDKHSRREPESHPIPAQGHPRSGPKPDRSRGPRHGAPPHRPLPS